MALVKCPDCSKPVSDKADACPSCGSPIASLMNPVLPETVNCLECKKDYPFNDNTCPHCGLFNSKRWKYKKPLEEFKEETNHISQSSKTPKNRSAAIFLAVVFGGLGAHKFYLEKPGQGVLYLIFCWSFIPSIFGLIEGIGYLTSSKESFENTYSI